MARWNVALIFSVDADTPGAADRAADELATQVVPGPSDATFEGSAVYGLAGQPPDAWRLGPVDRDALVPREARWTVEPCRVKNGQRDPKGKERWAVVTPAGRDWTYAETAEGAAQIAAHHNQ